MKPGFLFLIVSVAFSGMALLAAQSDAAAKVLEQAGAAYRSDRMLEMKGATTIEMHDEWSDIHVRSPFTLITGADKQYRFEATRNLKRISCWILRDRRRA